MWEGVGFGVGKAGEMWMNSCLTGDRTVWVTRQEREGRAGPRQSCPNG